MVRVREASQEGRSDMQAKTFICGIRLRHGSISAYLVPSRYPVDIFE